MEETKRVCLQQEDVTLEDTRKAADVHSVLMGDGFFKRRWLPRGRDEVEQPLKYRPEVLKLAPFAGHLERDKTVNQISQRFYWPTMFADVRRVVKKTAPRGRVKVPMVHHSEGLQWTLWDLVICNYATRFPEAILMKSIDAVRVAAEELLV